MKGRNFIFWKHKQTNKQASKRKNKFYSIDQSTLFKNEGKRITAEADKPEALQLH